MRDIRATRVGAGWAVGLATLVTGVLGAPARAQPGGLPAALATVAEHAVAASADPERGDGDDADAADACELLADPRTPERVRRCLRRPGLEWRSDWARSGVPDAIAFGIAATLGLVFTFVEPSDTPSWTRSIAFDQDARNALALSSRNGRETAAILSDELLTVLLLYPFVIDVFVVGILVQDSTDWAVETAIVSAVTLSIAFALTTASKTIASRERPFVRECEADPEYAAGCDLQDRDRNASFFSGHTSMAFASAGLMCSHHAHSRIHRDGVADVGVCVGGLLAASTVGALRIMADAHWLSDVLIGAGIGLTVGTLVPSLLRYREWNMGGRGDALTVLPVPQVGEGRAGLALIGSF